MTIDEIVQGIRDGSLRGFDGVMSPTSLRVQERLGSARIDMDEHWVWTSQDWTCPACGRTKLDIAKLGGQGQVVAKLVIHHDHAGDLIETEFNAAFAALGTAIPQVDGRMLVERLKGAFAAHEEVLVCEDCNNADASAKKRIGSPRGFSFSTRQIRSFVIARPNRPHDIDQSALTAAWQNAEPMYSVRRDMIGQIAAAAAGGNHWFEMFAGDGKPIPNYLDSADGRSLVSGLGSEALIAALAPRLPYSRDMTRWRTNTAPQRRLPPPNVEALVCSNKLHANTWTKAGPTWTCAVCARGRSQVVYMNGSAAVPGVGVPAHRSAFGKDYSICADCAAVLSALREEAKLISGAGPTYGRCWLSIEELRSLIESSSPHQKHALNGERALALVQQVVGRFVAGSRRD